jgi:hypothetical protein
MRVSMVSFHGAFPWRVSMARFHARFTMRVVIGARFRVRFVAAFARRVRGGGAMRGNARPFS